MMIPFTDEQMKLYDQLEKTTDKEEIKKIRQRLHEIAIKRDEELKGRPGGNKEMTEEEKRWVYDGIEFKRNQRRNGRR